MRHSVITAREKETVPRKGAEPSARKSTQASSQTQTSIPLAIANLIREQILNGELTPGSRITETRLTKNLKAGQPSVREALFMLEREGLVQRIPNVGTFVTESRL